MPPADKGQRGRLLGLQPAGWAGRANAGLDAGRAGQGAITLTRLVASL